MTVWHVSNQTSCMTDFHALYERYAPEVYRFALFLCGNASLADDLTSETFVRVWTSGVNIRQQTVKAYLFTIVRNLYADTRRSTRRLVALTDGTLHTKDTFQNEMEMRAELRVVLKAMEQLSEAERIPLVMRVEGEMSYEEIARSLQISVTAAKVRVHRARMRLMQITSSKEKADGEQ